MGLTARRLSRLRSPAGQRLFGEPDDQAARSPSTSDVHLGLRKAARGWLKAVATDRTAHPAQTLNFAGIYVALRTFA
jgi:hypothetical protein